MFAAGLPDFLIGRVLNYVTCGETIYYKYRKKMFLVKAGWILFVQDSVYIYRR